MRALCLAIQGHLWGMVELLAAAGALLGPHCSSHADCSKFRCPHSQFCNCVEMSRMPPSFLGDYCEDCGQDILDDVGYDCRRCSTAKYCSEDCRSASRHRHRHLCRPDLPCPCYCRACVNNRADMDDESYQCWAEASVECHEVYMQAMSCTHEIWHKR